MSYPGDPPYKKYRAIPTTVDGIRFASKREANRYGELKLLLRGSEIRELELQPKFPLVVNGLLVCTYIADFRYFDPRSGSYVIEDAKGFRTPEYIIKKKLLQAVRGIVIVEV